MIDFLTSTVGKKYLMGLSGLVWTGFVFAHMAGNLLVFVGPDAYNSYGHALTSGYMIYAVETALTLALLTHVGLAINLTMQNRAAKGSRYAVSGTREKGSNLASRTMAIQGSLVLVFIITHLATFKFGHIYMTEVNGVPMRDLFRLMVEVFAQPGYIFWYAVALAILLFHLSHGVGSIFQSFGLLHPSYQPMIKRVSWTYAIVVTAGFLSQPLYLFFFHR